MGFEVVTAGDGEEAQLEVGEFGSGEQRSEIGPSRNVPPFSNSIALDPFHILNKI